MRRWRSRTTSWSTETPKRAQVILYTNPDRAAGAYAHVQSWEFGETVRLPEPFGVVISTAGWEPEPWQ